MRRVRTAVTIPDDVYAAGERLARILTLTRSQLYADALAAYLAREDELVTESINRVANDPECADPGLDEFVAAAGRATFERIEREDGPFGGHDIV